MKLNPSEMSSSLGVYIKTLAKISWQIYKQIRNDLCKDADSQHAPDATDAVGDERAAGIVQAWLAVQQDVDR